MTPFRFGVLFLICIAWGLHFTVVKLTVSEIPVMFYVALRMAAVTLLLSPFLKWHKGQMHLILLAGVCFGALNYIFMFNGVKYTTASLGAVLVEMYMPIATIMSILFLSERIGWRRGMGLVLAFAGVVVIVTGENDTMGAANLPLGATLVLCGATCEASGAILVKKIKNVSALQLLAWFGVVGSTLSFTLSMATETGQWAALTGDSQWTILGALAYSVLLASIFGHASYYWLLQRVDVSQVAGPTMMTTIFAVLFGVLLLGDPLAPRFIVGAIVTFIGVAIIVLRTNQKNPELAETIVEEESHGA